MRSLEDNFFQLKVLGNVLLVLAAKRICHFMNLFYLQVITTFRARVYTYDQHVKEFCNKLLVAEAAC